MVEIINPIPLKKTESESVYNKNPKVKTKTELNHLRKKQIIIENELTKNFNCKTLSERVEEREKMLVFNSERSFLIKNRQENMKTLNTSGFEEKFSKRPMGVHGEELPKFNEYLKDYWKLKEGYIEHPYIKNKERPPSRPISVFTRLKPKSSSVDYEISSKPNEINPFQGYLESENNKSVAGASSRSRYTDGINYFYSRPSSQLSSQEANSVKYIRLRQMSAVEDSKSSLISNINRPCTTSAHSRINNERNHIRSGGFN